MATNTFFVILRQIYLLTGHKTFPVKIKEWLDCGLEIIYKEKKNLSIRVLEKRAAIVLLCKSEKYTNTKVLSS